jgi:hypothetical protein
MRSSNIDHELSGELHQMIANAGKSIDIKLNECSFKYGYLKNVGYYCYQEVEKGQYEMLPGFPTKELDQAYLQLLLIYLPVTLYSIESEYREALTSFWALSYPKLEYDSRIFVYEMTLSSLETILGNIPDLAITHAEEILENWQYNKIEKVFVYVPNKTKNISPKKN